MNGSHLGTQCRLGRVSANNSFAANSAGCHKVERRGQVKGARVRLFSWVSRFFWQDIVNAISIQKGGWVKIFVRSQRWNKQQNGKRSIQSQPAGGDVDVGVAPKGKPIWKPVTWTCLVFLHIETFPASNSHFGCLAQPRAQEWDSLFFTPEMLARAQMPEIPKCYTERY